MRQFPSEAFCVWRLKSSILGAFGCSMPSGGVQRRDLCATCRRMLTLARLANPSLLTGECPWVWGIVTGGENPQFNDVSITLIFSPAGFASARMLEARTGPGPQAQIEKKARKKAGSLWKSTWAILPREWVKSCLGALQKGSWHQACTGLSVLCGHIG